MRIAPPRAPGLSAKTADDAGANPPYRTFHISLITNRRTGDSREKPALASDDAPPGR
jgi:hypothetical protein